MTIGIIGNFGDNQNLYNGQTIKTKTVIKALKEKYPQYEIVCADTNRKKNSKHRIIKNIIKVLFSTDLVILMVADYAIKYLSVVSYIIIKIRRKHIFYILIGGWLGKYVEQNKIAGLALKKYDIIFSETQVTMNELKRVGFKNVCKLDNCKFLKQIEKIKEDTSDLKLCIVSRIVKEKGIEDAIVAVKKSAANRSEYIQLDIYGEIAQEYESEFFNLIKNNLEFATYCGKLEYNMCPQIISKYDALLFPTKVLTEGIPGTVIDAMFAGTPVIASYWNSFNEIIVDGINGIGYENGVDGLVNILSEEPIKEKLKKMRKNCTQYSYKYMPNIALIPLFTAIDKLEK